MSFGAFNRNNSSKWLLCLAFMATTAETACGQPRSDIQEKILSGAEYAHYLRLTGGFLPPSALHDQANLDHLSVRIPPSSPDLLVVAACGYVDLGEQCSTNGFLIDTAHDYSIVSAMPNDWEQAKPISGSGNLTDPNPPYSITPLGVRVNASGATEGEPTGWTVKGKSYPGRGDWITSLITRASGDGSLVVLAGADKRRLPSRGLFFGDPVSDGAYGYLTLDVFIGGPERKVASLDLECKMATATCRRYVTVIDSRRLILGLTRDLSRVILFDFGPQQDLQKK